MLAVCAIQWRLVLLLSFQVVNGIQDLEHHGVSIMADGHLISQSHHNAGAVIVRRESGVTKLDDENEQPISLKHPSQGSGALHHMDIANATAQLTQLLPVLGGGLKCNSVVFAPADPCPFECPYLAEDAEFICHFRCLTAVQCGTLDPLAKIADSEDMICRQCKVMGCEDCIPGTKDTCRQCEAGYKLDPYDGLCYSPISWVMFGLKIFCAIVVFLVFVIFAELLTRKKTNWKGFKHGAAFRWRTRLHMPLGTPHEDGVDDTDNADETIHELLLYPLSTNLLRQPIAGAGFCLHMNFCIAVLIWAAVIIYVYTFTACMVSIDMLVLGLSPAKTSQQLCEVVHWGHDAQMRLIWAKTGFVGFAYFFTFIGCLAFGIYQKKEFHRLDDESTMGDFAAFVSGLPALQGSDRAEDELARFIEQTTGQPVRGASICWNYTEHKEVLHQAIEADWKEREEELNPPEPEDPENPTPRQPRLGFVRRQFRKLDCLLGFQMPKNPPAEGENDEGDDAATTPLVSAEEEGPDEAEITNILNEMQSADCAFVVFDTEEARNAAIENVKSKENSGQAVEYMDCKISLMTKNCEPESVRFAGLAYGVQSSYRAKKMTSGFFMTLVALAIWAGVFYLPYAYYMCSFSYAHGEEPDAFASNVFTLLVVAGNQGMYFLADVVAERAMFGFEDDREVAYNYVYVTAVVLNTVLDLSIVIWLAYRIMVGIGAHTADDRLLANLTDFQDIFESYPIQKVFGELLYEYSFPACFAFPFVLEGLFTILVPYVVGKHLVLSHDEVQGRDAELSMLYFLPMNLGRYADIILNMILCCFVFFCPGGFTLPLFMAFFFSHACIYLYDHCRTLRCTPSFHYASTEVDYFGQVQLIMPTAVLGGCFFFRISQMYPSKVFDGAILYACGLSAFVLHCLVHWAMIKFVVPLWEPPPHEASTKSYEDIAQKNAITWFSANPVHCLRSKYIFKDDPPNIHCIYGKEHLQKVNEGVGAYFEDSKFGQAYSNTKALKNEEDEDKIARQDEKLAAEADAEDDI